MASADSRSGMDDRHLQFLARYQELLRKYQDVVTRRSHSGALGDWLLRHTAEGVVLVEAGRLVSANPRFFAWAARHPDWCELDGDSSPRPETLISAVCRLAEELAVPESRTCRLRPYRGSAPTLEVRGYPFGQGPASRSAVLVRDISDREEWRRDREESGVRDRFLATLAHELRSPLSTVTTAAELLRESDDPQVRRAAEVIARQSRQQARMIEDLLDVARVREGKLELQRETVDLRQVVRDAVEATEPRRRGGPRLAVELPDRDVLVPGDPARLVQVVSNLLHNAAKFTPDEGATGIQLGAGQGIAWIRVWDTGKGIAAEALPRIWEPFFQQATDGDSRAGLGIGLALVKNLMRLHEGGVRAASEGPGQGAEFTVWLPLAGGAAHSSTRRRREPAERPLRVLVVQEPGEERDALTALLSARGHEVTTAGSVADAIGEILRSRPERVLCGLREPEQNGITLVHAVRPLLPDAVLIGTGNYANERKECAQFAPFDARLEQPLDVNRLFTLLECDPPPQITDYPPWYAYHDV